jgi:DNA-binding NarL/FixJ family response regulator
MNTKTTVLIVDDHPFTREGLRFFLRSTDDFEVIGEATSGPDAVAKALELRPQFVIMDLRLPVFDGFEATRQLRQILPSAHVVILTTDLNGDLEERARNAGALGWIPKSSSPGELIGALRQVALQVAAAEP